MIRKFIAPIILGFSLIFIGCDSVTDSNTDNLSASPSPESSERVFGAGNNGSEATRTIYDIASTTDRFSTLAAAIEFTGLQDEFDQRTQFTVFAPNNDALQQFLSENGLSLEEQYKEAIKEVLLYHVVKGNKQANSVVNSKQLFTLQGTFINVNVDENGAFVGNQENGFAPIVNADIDASNGVIHEIGGVMVPPTEFNPGNRNN